MKKFWKWIRYIGGTIVLVSLLVYVTFQGYYWLINKQAKSKLTNKSVLTEDGHQYRDLNANSILDAYEDNRQPVEARVEDLLSQMNLQEKVGLLWHPPIAAGKKGQVLGKPAIMSPSSSYDIIINQKVRYFNLFEVPDANFMARWNNRIQKIAEQDRLGIPVSLSSDPRNGVKNFLGDMLDGKYSKWPEPIGLAALQDSLLTGRFAQIAAHEMRSVGIRIALHPMADLATEPRWARIHGTFGEDARLTANMVSAYIRGFQGDSLGHSSVACMTKHWPGGGPQERGEDPHFRYGKNQVYPGNNFDYHLIPFKAAIDAGSAMMMPYYGIPLDQTSQNVGMSFNPEIVNKLLRIDHGYDGVVCTDWGVIEGFSLAGFELVEAKDWGVEHLEIEDKIVMALDAGVDQFGGNSNTKQLIAALQKGKVTEERLNESVRRLLRLKFQLGLFDDPFVDEKLADQVVGNDDYMEEGADAQRKSMVLLKNQRMANGPVLPLKEGIKLYVENIDKQHAGRYASIVDEPERADVAIIRLETPYEYRDDDFIEQFFHQGALDFTPEEINRLVSLANSIPTVFFIYMDRPPVMPEINQAAMAVVAEFGCYDPAVLDVAFGRARPEGRLPFEIPSSMQSVRSQYEDVPYDSSNPLYPFGYGLKYD
ncbi:MAG: beta-glucosidase [Cyclobacteriaceae bacterium]|nr:MAG: beta-glucosidase [Cyclobacteriaceae bacterium]